MNQASIFFRVFDLAFFAPGLVILLPVWMTWRHVWAADKLDVVNGVMAAGAWILLSYVVGLLIHGLARLFLASKVGRARAGLRELSGLAALLLLLWGLSNTMPWPIGVAAALSLGAVALWTGQRFGKARYAVKEATKGAEEESMTTPFDRAKQQELSLYFWYLRATCYNVALSIPISLAIWAGLAGQPTGICREAWLSWATNCPPTASAGVMLIGATATFVLAMSGAEFHQAWKHARRVLVQSHARADALAEMAANKPG